MQTPSPPLPEAERPVVLVVDDAPSSLGMLCDTLEASGYTVLVAADGESALQRLALVVPDAILLDGMMPGLSGFETCRR
ncbi:response regulator, partial [Variovorax sp. CT11-76]